MKKFERILIGVLVLGLGIIYLNTKYDLLGREVNFRMPFHKAKLSISEQKPYITKIESSSDWLGLKAEDRYLIKQGAVLSLLVKPECFSPRLSGESLSFVKKDWNNKRQSFPSGYKSFPYKIEKDVFSEVLAKQLEKQACVLGVSNRRELYPTAMWKDPLRDRQTHLKSLKLLNNPQLDKLIGMQRQKVIVAVIDTGIDMDHPDLKDFIWENSMEKKGRPHFDDDGNGYVDDIHGFDFGSRNSDPSHKNSFDHGTHVSGLIAAKSNNNFGIGSPIGPNLELMILNVTGKYKSAMIEDIEEAIYYAINKGAHIINISLGSPGRADTLAYAIGAAVKRGVFVVSSAGNQSESLDDKFYLPASYAADIPGFMSVGAYEVQTNELCNNSNFSPSFVEIAAPGCDYNNPKQGLFSTRAGGVFGYYKGTSMAAPILTSAAAVLYGSRDQYEIKEDTAYWIEKFFKDRAKYSNKLNQKIQGSRHLDYGVFFDNMQ
ncbi:MAG: S8 family serine peptidase [Bdellovibrionota bacterium]|nr:S8 family serine peptidase [Bdellovibrionota bacterium]